MKDIRRKSANEVASVLRARLDGIYEADKDTFEARAPFDNRFYRLQGSNGRSMHRILAQTTDWVMRRCHLPSNLSDYLKRNGKGAFEIEHIWADKPNQHSHEFDNAAEFYEHRNRIGGLLLLPKSFNAAFGAKTYEEKLPHYNGQNMLARALTCSAYSNNPGFVALNAELQHPFRPYKVFNRSALDDRQETMRQLSMLIWSPERLDLALSTE
ncbi:MAG: HNH endonuclease [Acetobacteraceae bacterium]|nr:HNH endonuclease [Acetobacteraceae bacterium]